ncbi:HicB family protein [Moorella sp. E308F]|uniref:type II toxin-antitoxin system HicB family antitoxin n=1 Tax=unclassified Neomoorella TaxID=2676739 RepID=UPI0010FFB861|nr:MULTISPECIES: type II toxin-antitoxin system HicB family antitoxin [unclassified Moorella (in: firmicutes)]GEA15139.1 HicB family protein [Moorella sp. E308F]GEA16949.1 HicB family protein [Moorella sp. E306M]
MSSHRFLVVIEQDEDGKYIASVPSLPGCHTQADNLTDLEKRIQEAIKLYLNENGHVIMAAEKFIGIHQVEVQA